MLSALRRAKRKFFPAPYVPEREVPSPKVNYNQPHAANMHEYARIFKERACLNEMPFFMKNGLTPKSAFLDYGCGLGRIAYPASKYLDADGAYFGYEPQEGARAFLKEAYGHLPNFHFDGKPLRLEEDYVAYEQNQKRDGGATGTEVDLSFVTRPIDVQYTSSVFTHMYQDPIVSVLKAVGKVMSPTGVCANTWLCIDDYAAYVLRCGLADRKLPYRIGNMWAVSEKSPLMSVAYELETIKEIYAAADHEILDILYGSWSGRDNGVTYIDIVMSRPRR